MLRWILILAAFLPCAGMAREYEFRPGQTLGQTDTASDFVFKGTAVSNTPTGAPLIHDSNLFFGSGDTFAETLTQFKIVSVIKGDKNTDAITFRHYEDITPQNERRGWLGVAYHFEPGRTYLVFASTTGTAGLCKQLGTGYHFKTDYGAVRCANDQPVTAKTIHEIVWDELAAMLHDKDTSDVQYAMAQLDQLSGGLDFPADYRYGLDFQRQNVSELVRGLVYDPDPSIARTAIAAIGSHNPYMDESLAANWMAKVGAVTVPGLTPLGEAKNPGGAQYWWDLASVADGKTDGTTRALAIVALGIVREPALKSHLAHWLTDPDAAVRGSAAVLLADFPDMATRERIAKLAADPDSTVAAAVARSIGFGQCAEFADILSGLLRHPDPKVHKYAAMSLLSFSPDTPGVAAAMNANLDDPVYGAVITNAVAGKYPDRYFDHLVQVAEGKLKVPFGAWWGGHNPADTAWRTLFNYIKAQPPESLRSGRLDSWLDALDQIVMTAPHRHEHDLLDFYNQRGLTARAQKLGASQPQ